MAIGEVVLGAILQVLFQMMAPPIIDKFTQFIGVNEEVKKLESVLRSVEKVLKNADEELHKDWLDELGDIAYDMEDLLDEINTERLRLEAMASREHGRSFSTLLQDLNRKFSKLKLKDRPFRKLSNTFSHSVEQFRRPTKKKITLILNRLEEKVKISAKLGLDKVAVPTATQANKLGVDAIFVYTKTGQMASFLSRCRPDCPIFAFTSTTSGSKTPES